MRALCPGTLHLLQTRLRLFAGSRWPDSVKAIEAGVSSPRVSAGKVGVVVGTADDVVGTAEVVDEALYSPSFFHLQGVDVWSNVNQWLSVNDQRLILFLLFF